MRASHGRARSCTRLPYVSAVRDARHRGLPAEAPEGTPRGPVRARRVATTHTRSRLAPSSNRAIRPLARSRRRMMIVRCWQGPRRPSATTRRARTHRRARGPPASATPGCPDRHGTASGSHQSPAPRSCAAPPRSLRGSGRRQSAAGTRGGPGRCLPRHGITSPCSRAAHQGTVGPHARRVDRASSVPHPSTRRVHRPAPPGR